MANTEISTCDTCGDALYLCCDLFYVQVSGTLPSGKFGPIRDLSLCTACMRAMRPYVGTKSERAARELDTALSARRDLDVCELCYRVNRDPDETFTWVLASGEVLPICRECNTLLLDRSGDT